MTATRDEIHRAIDRWPGIHFNELVRRLGLAPGQVQYHIKRLRHDGAIVHEPLFGRTHYFSPEIERSDRRAIALLRRETPRAVVSYLLERGAVRPQQLATDLDLARSTVSYHVDRLRKVGLVESVDSPGGPVTIRVVDPDRVRSAIHLIEPDLSTRFTDRFERLIDHLLEE